MATEMSSEDMRRLARLGAERRLQELQQEEAAIRAAFPDLGGEGNSEAPRRRGRPGRKPRGSSDGSTGGGDAQAATGGSAKRRRRRIMSAAERRAVSERMKKYWAGRRKARG